MLPLSDESSRRAFPLVTIGIISLNLLAFLYELNLGDGIESFLNVAAVIPAEYACRCDIPPPDVGPFWVTTFTSMFLHAGWLHIGGNMLYLWIFGDNVEDAFGRLTYLVFYLASGVAASIAQIAADPSATVPSLGASGAIAGVLAAYLVLFPSARIRTLLFIGPFITLRRIPALVLIGLWFVLQVFDGLSSIGDAATSSGGVAYWAHIGGFVFGLVATVAVRSRRTALLASG